MVYGSYPHTESGLAKSTIALIVFSAHPPFDGLSTHRKPQPRKPDLVLRLESQKEAEAIKPPLLFR